MTALSPGDRIAGYVVAAVLGRGGYATVYRAQPAGSQAVVALKVLDESHREPVHLARLQREFEIAVRLDHPHVVTVYDAGREWLSMELIAGGSVTVLTRRGDRLTALAQIAGALDYAHRLGIVHCDVKPSNILVSRDFARSGAVLVDFGVAHTVTEDAGRRPTHVDASLQYCAPELLTARAPSAATDEYALACTALQLLTGAPPFRGRTPMELVDQHLYRRPPRISRQLGAPHALDAIVAKALAKSPEHRYDTCAEFIAAITRALN